MTSAPSASEVTSGIVVKGTGLLKWSEWVEKNAQPKRVFYPRPRQPTQWQKRGPMKRKDWVRFYKWAAEKAVYIDEGIIRDHLEQKYQKLKERLDKALPEAERKKRERKEKKEKKPPKQKSLKELLERIEKLSVQLPRKKRDKYDYPPEPEYAYSPQIDVSQPPRKDRGRPFAPPSVPKVFQHIDIQEEFWFTLRFPLRPSTLKYVATDKIRALAKPKLVPKQHCKFGNKKKPPEVIPERKRMSYRQWREHLRRLQYLAKPVNRPLNSFCC